jgi:hypothetical protein
MKNKKAILSAACLLLIYLAPNQAAAQSTRREYAPASDHLLNYGSSPNLNSITSEDPGGNPDVPLDGGISLLVAAGVALGAKKAHAARKGKLKDNSNN